MEPKRKKELRDAKPKAQRTALGSMCAGVTHEYGLNANILSVIVVLGFAINGIGPIAYLIAWLLMPAD